jgi:hypothetical protein
MYNNNNNNNKMVFIKRDMNKTFLKALKSKMKSIKDNYKLFCRITGIPSTMSTRTKCQK